MNSGRVWASGKYLIDLADVIGEAAEHLGRAESVMGINDLAEVVGRIERIEILPGELLVGDFVQRPKPAGALRLLERPRLMGAGGFYRLWGWSNWLGEETLYRGQDLLLPVVRGFPLGRRDEDAIARRSRIMARHGLGGGVA